MRKPRRGFNSRGVEVVREVGEVETLFEMIQTLARTSISNRIAARKNSVYGVDLDPSWSIFWH